MSLCKQSKTLSDHQINALLGHVSRRRNSSRNRVIVLLSVKAGLRAKEISRLKWSMLKDSDGKIGDSIHLENQASKGRSGRVIAMNRMLRDSLTELHREEQQDARADLVHGNVVRTERAIATSSQVIVNMFFRWYRQLGYLGCSSHSGRRTFITNAARKIGMVGGSLRDVQMLAGHSNLQTTQRYIEHDVECQRKVVNLV